MEIDPPRPLAPVHFTHRDLLDEAALRDHEDGWDKTFDNLWRVVEAV